MSKKSKKRSSSAFKPRRINFKDTMISLGAMAGGLAVGSYVNKFLSKEGKEVAGLSGEVSDYVAPAITTALGLVAMKMANGTIAKDMSKGLSLAGGIAIINKAAGKELVSLSGTDDQTPRLPGVGEVTFPSPRPLPSNNQIMQQFNPAHPIAPMSGVGDVKARKQVSII